METLGSLIDKLTIVKLKEYHTTPHNMQKQESLSSQEFQLRQEIDEYARAAIAGEIPQERLRQPSNKVYTGLIVPTSVFASLGGTIAQLAMVNCDTWHQQEKVYEFRKVPPALKDEVIEQLAILNLQRNKCIEEIDRKFKEMITK